MAEGSEAVVRGMVVVMDVDAVIFALSGLRPVEFTAARDAYVAQARREEDKAAAAAIGRLRKPRLAVWAANLVARTHPDQAEALLRLGTGLRRAHRELDGGQLRALTHEQHRVIGALAREAGQLAADAGEPLKETVLRELEQLFHGMLADEEAALAWAAGRLVKAPAMAIGFDGLEPAPGATPPPAAPVPRRPAAAAPSRAVDEDHEDAVAQRAAEKRRARSAVARERAEEAAAALRLAEEELAEAEADHERAEGELAALRAELATLEQRVDAARQTAREAEHLHRQADRARAKALRAAESATRRVEELDKDEEEGDEGAGAGRSRR
ncbi:hypothetical protein J7E97_19550 [Streptomyces sp. ISL-66]|uniref:hypothetical protein n=1 Tax=Streptomyces sp. ISL-66 TaxID=2819186 RepID=UPI001BEB3CBF|nr:hypothetical protein [Streptomyces sp. ISL-66]MBT2470010.1 hypothetical protein [Streptomyces sp. ISL-66]